jgi:peptidoglycan/LPS O-acetylase OafA/YrhL
LDALRGLAALTVVLGHFSSANLDESKVWHGSRLGLALFALNRPFTSGREAVLLFFLLSGLVLALPSVDSRPLSYSVFITRRIFRLYVPYLAALAFAVAGNLVWHGPLHLTPWANQTWYDPVHPRAVADHILFVGQYNASQFNTAFWSLVIEMRISIIFPLLCLLVLRIRPWISIAMVCAISIVASYFEGKAGLNAMELNAHYMGFFIIGILLAQYKAPLVKWTSSFSLRVAVTWFAAALFLYWYGKFAAMLFAKYILKAADVKLIGYEWASGIGAAVLIVLSFSFLPFSQFLLSRIPQYLGKISYGIYLVHSTILFALLHLMSKKVPLEVILAIYILLVLLIATVMYKYVEKPAIDFGRQIASRVNLFVLRPHLPTPHA